MIGTKLANQCLRCNIGVGTEKAGYRKEEAEKKLQTTSQGWFRVRRAKIMVALAVFPIGKSKPFQAKTASNIICKTSLWESIALCIKVQTDVCCCKVLWGIKVQLYFRGDIASVIQKAQWSQEV
mmetsp:Transcript_27693/g.67398  ORF Transcript_27693/g.67398 Transcript_27693/m.67398 type:complete len:124 (+) Transcript_27693:1318-1689(+)